MRVNATAQTARHCYTLRFWFLIVQVKNLTIAKKYILAACNVCINFFFLYDVTYHNTYDIWIYKTSFIPLCKHKHKINRLVLAILIRGSVNVFVPFPLWLFQIKTKTNAVTVMFMFHPFSTKPIGTDDNRRN